MANLLERLNGVTRVVLHMDWTTTGAPPPIFTVPRAICFVFLRGIILFNALPVTSNIKS
jgi:hypothetical protein